VRYRRARATIAYWSDGALCFENYGTRVTISARPIVAQILSFFDAWRRPEELRSHLPEYSASSVARTIRQLIAHTLLVREGTPAAARDAAIEREWAPWLPEGSFHFATKNARYIDPRWDVARRQRTLPKTPQPPFFKRYRHAAKIPLVRPRPQASTADFERVLLARKTHRAFSRRALALDDVSRLLWLVWGVHGYIESPIFGRLAHKTSPSGGARHPGEVYLLAQRINGIASGFYHYNPVAHQLETLTTGPTRRRAWRYCVRQPHARSAAALFVMTAVFPRTMWKYHAGRAYRVVLLDAGHLCQTFCLTATAMGLGPFCTAALDDTLIERDLGIDGIRESVLYVAGLGVPADVD
jgi:SagB-type dehydrogenase family enzyme